MSCVNAILNSLSSFGEINYPDEETRKTWDTLRMEVVHRPQTGEIKPWELHGVFSYPYHSRKHWGSFKTEVAANKKKTRLQKVYPQSVRNEQT
jgi:hypothetical protein